MNKLSLRAGLAITVALTPVLLLGACHKKPSGQVVATVNGDDITRSELEAEYRALNVPPSQRGRARNNVLNAIIERKLAVDAAKAAKIDKNPNYLILKQRADEQLLATIYVDQLVKQAQLEPSQDQVTQFVNTHPMVSSERASLTVNQLRFPTDNATAMQQTKGVMSMDALIDVLKRNGVRYQSGTGQIDTATIPDEIVTPMKQLKPGEPLIIVQGPLAVAMTLAGSTPRPTTGPEANRIAVARLKSEAAAKLVKQRGDALRSQAKITYADGYQPGAPAVGSPTPAAGTNTPRKVTPAL